MGVNIFGSWEYGSRTFSGLCRGFFRSVPFLAIGLFKFVVGTSAKTWQRKRITIPGWWFGTYFYFPYIGNNKPNWLIFFRGVETTNQITILYDIRTSNMGTVYSTHIMKPSRGDTPQDWFQPTARVCMNPFGLARRRSRQGISKICIYIYIYNILPPVFKHLYNIYVT